VRARWLNAGTGNWLSVDPIQSEPRYSYVRNRPNLLVDPTGLNPPRRPQNGVDRFFNAVGAVYNNVSQGVVQTWNSGVQVGKQLIVTTKEKISVGVNWLKD